MNLYLIVACLAATNCQKNVLNGGALCLSHHHRPFRMNVLHTQTTFLFTPKRG